MAYDGYFAFGGVEIVNLPRLRAYMDAHFPGAMVSCKCQCDELPAILGDNHYTTPLSDEAPWVDGDDPDSADFYGAMVNSVRGLEDSVREVFYDEAIWHGGTVTGARSAAREVRFVLSLFAGSDAGMASGWRWFKSVFADDCQDPCSGGTDLCFFSACPPLGEPVGVEVSKEVPLDQLHAVGGDWDGYTFTPTDDPVIPQNGFFFVPAGTQSPPGFWEIDGVQDPPGWWEITPPSLLRTPRADRPLNCGPVTWTFTLYGQSEAMIRVVGPEGEISRDIATLDPDFPTVLSATDMGIPEHSDGVHAEVWYAGQDLVVESVTRSWHQPPEPGQACADNYRRLLHDVVAVDGPRVMQDQEMPNGGVKRTVEVTVAAMTPDIFGVPKMLGAFYHGQRYTRLGTTIGNWFVDVPPCDYVDEPLIDPDCPPLAPIPDVPDVEVVCSPPNFSSSSTVFTIPPEVLHDWTDSVPIIEIRSDSAVRGVRARFFPKIREDMTPQDIEGCSACGGFQVTYIPPNSVMKIDGTRKRVVVEEAGGRTRQASHLLASGEGNTPLSWPVLGCGLGYYVLLESSGESLGGVTLSVATRE